MIGTRRGELDVLHDILRALEPGERRTALMDQARLSATMLRRYLAALEAAHCLTAQPDGRLFLTAHGRRLAADVQRVRAYFEGQK